MRNRNGHLLNNIRIQAKRLNRFTSVDLQNALKVKKRYANVPTTFELGKLVIGHKIGRKVGVVRSPTNTRLLLFEYIESEQGVMPK